MGIALAISGRPLLEVDAETISIGSDPASAIVLTGTGIRPRHAVIRRAAGRWMVEAREAESIQVGSAPAARAHWLKPGDVIRLGEGAPEITFQPAKGTAADAPAKPAPHSVAETPRTVSAGPSAVGKSSVGKKSSIFQQRMALPKQCV